MYILLFVYPLSVDTHLVCFYLLAIVNNSVMNIDFQVSVWVPTFNPFGYILRSGIVASYGNSMFNFLRNHQIVFCSGCNILYFTSNAQGLQFQFLHILSSTYSQFVCVCVCVCVCVRERERERDNSHPNPCEVVFHCGFDLHFPND